MAKVFRINTSILRYYDVSACLINKSYLYKYDVVPMWLFLSTIQITYSIQILNGV